MGSGQHALSRWRLVVPLLLPVAATVAAPFIPDSDAQVVETLPARATDPRMREMRDLRQALRLNPGDVDVAVRLARRYGSEQSAGFVNGVAEALALRLRMPPPSAEAKAAPVRPPEGGLAGRGLQGREGDRPSPSTGVEGTKKEEDG